MKICSHCGTELPDEARFCMACGGAQPAEAPPGAESLAQPQVGAQTNIAGGVTGPALTGQFTGPVTVYPPPGAPTDPAELARCYLHHLFEQVGQLSLSGIDPKAASEAEARLNLGAVYTALLTLTPEECDRMQKGDCLPERMARGERRLSALAHLDRQPRLVLLGDPGSGKSTFVNFVALCLAGESLGRADANLERLREPLPKEEGDDDEKAPEPQPWSHGPLAPLRVTLRDFAARGLPPVGEQAAAKHLWDFIAAELDAAALGDYAPHLAQTLFKSGGLLLLDGLDEVPEAEQRRTQIKQAVEDFAATFRRVRILVTSRTYAYQQQAWRLSGFAEAVLAPFGQAQIERFVERWYAHIAPLRALHPADAQGRAELLKRAIAGSDRLRALAERPLLLTLMASLHAWRGGSLPEKREELYADTVDLLLDWWERPKVVRAGDQVRVQQPSLAEWLRVDRDQVRALLEELAHGAHAGQADPVGTADVPEGELLSRLLRLSRNPEVNLNPARLVEYLSQRAGLLLPRGVGVYTFPHRTFQEYLAACYLTDHDYPDRVAELARADPNRWREAALLAGAKAARGTASAVWALVDALCYHDLPADGSLPPPDAWGALLAGQALVESADLSQVGERNRPRLDLVRAHLARILEEGALPAVERAAAGRALARLGDPRPGVGLLPPPLTPGWGLGVPDIAWCEVPAGPFTMGSSDADAIAYDDEKPQHTVDLPAFRISRYPITNAQFSAFVQAGGYREPRYWQEAAAAGRWRDGKIKRGYYILGGDDLKLVDAEEADVPYNFGEPFNLPNHPVVGVTWYEAAAFCHWLTERMQEAGCKARVWRGDRIEEVSLPLASCVVRLPSEAEWEKAARGPLPSPAQGDHPSPARGGGAGGGGGAGAALPSPSGEEGPGVRVYPHMRQLNFG